MVDALKAAGADVKFTVYPNTGHDAWTPAYDDPELYTWLLAQKRRR
jgi:predicted peptidase